MQVGDAGSYFCKGNNTHGEETQTFQLVVTDASYKVYTIVESFDPVVSAIIEDKAVYTRHEGDNNVIDMV